MISVELARALLSGGVLWQPESGDRFVIDKPALTDQVFWISDLTIEVHHWGGQSILGFNGTTEWALDSVDLDQALWLPREDQLRELLGDRLTRIERVGTPEEEDAAGETMDGGEAVGASEAEGDGESEGEVVSASIGEGAGVGTGQGTGEESATWRVTLADGTQVTDPDVEHAYARALIAYL